MTNDTTYVLMTAARNEEQYIGVTLESVTAQTVLPALWVIVDDGSDDRTAAIVKQYQQKFDFIDLVSRQAGVKRDFGSKALALAAARERLGDIDFRYAGTLDADVSFETDFYERLISRFEHEPKLGLCGGVIWEMKAGVWHYVHLNPDWCIGGATHFFRRECFDVTGTAPNLRYGGEDTILEFRARAAGWNVRAVMDCRVNHHRPTVILRHHRLRQSFRKGMQEYLWGSDPLYETIKCLGRMIQPPLVVGGLARLAGYVWCAGTRVSGGVSNEEKKMVRSQQRVRLYASIARFFRRNKR